MFKNIYPLFERKRLLKKEMLEILRDYPRDIFQILYQDYSNGILAGCELETTDGSLVVHPGIIYYNEIPYILDDDWKVSYEATGKQSYLKVRFSDKTAGIGQDEYLSQIYWDDRIPDDSHEIELARFKLQSGARLRDSYTDFFDLDTEFDTINRIYSPYASVGKHSIYPQILKKFAEVLMQHPIQNQWDYPFCLDCMKLQTAMPYDEIRTYLNMRLNQTAKEYRNKEIYDGLSCILSEAGGKKDREHRSDKGDRKLLLL